MLTKPLFSITLAQNVIHKRKVLVLKGGARRVVTESVIPREGQNCWDYLRRVRDTFINNKSSIFFFLKRNLFSVLYLCGIPRKATFSCPESKLMIFSCSLVKILKTTFYLLLDPELCYCVLLQGRKAKSPCSVLFQ